MKYLVLLGANENNDDEAYPCPEWDAMNEQQKEKLENDNSQIIGMCYGGIYEAANEQDAIKIALDAIRESGDHIIAGA